MLARVLNWCRSASLTRRALKQWSDYKTMNLLKQLFGRRPQVETAPSPFVGWAGESGNEYQYEAQALDTAFKALPGNFIYAMQSEDGNWIPIYIAQTRDMHQRLEGHVSMDDAVASGATHIHAHYCTTGQSARCAEERDLIHRWQPVCNDPVES